MVVTMTDAPASDYEIAFDSNSDQYSDTTQTDIKVEAGKETNLSNINLE